MDGEDERLSRLQLKILKAMNKELLEQNWCVVRDKNEEPTIWIYNWAVYRDVRKAYRKRRLSLQEICEKKNISAEIMKKKLKSISIFDRRDYLDQWNDDSLRVSYYRSIQNLYKKGLIEVGYTRNGDKAKVMTFTQKGYDLFCKKIKKKKDMNI